MTILAALMTPARAPRPRCTQIKAPPFSGNMVASSAAINACGIVKRIGRIASLSRRETDHEASDPQQRHRTRAALAQRPGIDWIRYDQCTTRSQRTAAVKANLPLPARTARRICDQPRNKRPSATASRHRQIRSTIQTRTDVMKKAIATKRRNEIRRGLFARAGLAPLASSPTPSPSSTSIIRIVNDSRANAAGSTAATTVGSYRPTSQSATHCPWGPSSAVLFGFGGGGRLGRPDGRLRHATDALDRGAS